jgi:hypothetical protein
MTGTPEQIAWAERIKPQVAGEFDRVAMAFEKAAGKQSDQDRLDTHAIIAILDEKRREVMAQYEAGYFIHDWQELKDQVRQMIGKDPRYQAIKVNREARGHSKKAATGSPATGAGSQ